MGDYYRGGGGRRPPKRRYRDDDEQEYRRSRPYEREDPLSRFRKDTFAIAESPLVKIEDAIKNIATAFTSNYENEELRAGMLSSIQSLVIEQPFKVPFAATIVLVANSENAEVGKLVVEEFSKAAQRALSEGAFTPLKLILRAFACLQGMLEGRGVFPWLETLVEKAASLNGPGDEGLSLELLKVVLMTLPYVLTSLKDETEEVRELLKKTEPITKKTHPMQSLLNPFTGDTAPYDKRAKGTHMVRILQLSLQSHLDHTPENEHSGIGTLPRPWAEFEAEFGAASKHTLSELTAPEEFPIDKTAVQPEIYFSVYADQSVETVPPPLELASTLIRDNIVDTINILDCNRLAVSRYLIEIDCFFSPKAFVKRAIPFDRVKETAGSSGSTWKPEDVAVDAIFSQLFRLSTPPHKLVYYHSILTELCKLAPAAIAPSMGRAIRFIYRNLESMDTELIYRFVDWFSHHLSNFGFTWKWAEWNESLTLPDVHPKKAFILGALEKEIRLSFATRIKGTIPDPYKELITEAQEKEQPVFKYDLDTEPFAEEGKALLHLIADKKDDLEIDEIMNKITETAKSQNLPDPTWYARDAYVTSICHVGAKSLSHVLSCIERCKEKLLAIGEDTPEARQQIVGSVLGYWKDQPGIGANVVDKLLNYSIVTPLSVIHWVLHNAGSTALSQNHAWEMCSTTINKVNNRVRQMALARPAVEGGAEAGYTEEQVAVYEETLKNAEIEQGFIFKSVTESLTAIASGGDELTAGMDVESMAWMQWWAKGWLRALGRRFGVKEEKPEEKVEAAVDVEENMME
ncbi:Nuclear cap-binding protein subunit 1 [Rhizina undulata]